MEVKNLKLEMKEIFITCIKFLYNFQFLAVNYNICIKTSIFFSLEGIDKMMKKYLKYHRFENSRNELKIDNNYL